LRNFGKQSEKILEDMPITYDIEKDSLYKKGLEKGLQKGLQKGEKKGLEEGLQKGEKKGLEKGLEEGLERGIRVCYEIGLPAEEIALKFNLDLNDVLRIIKQL